MSDKILTVIELDNYPERVVARATWLAGKTGADIELLLCDPTASYLRTAFTVSNEARELVSDIDGLERSILDTLAAEPRSKGLQVNTAISHERPIHDVIIERALDTAPTFVIKGTHYHTPAERATFSDTDWQLMKKLDYPLWFVKPSEWKPQPLIVAAVDPMHERDESALLDARIVAMARTIANACDGRIELLHTYQRLVEIGSKAMWTFKPVELSIDELDEKIRDEHRDKLDRFALDCGIPDDAVHQLPGRAHELLPSFANSQGASLIVMGALARSGSRRRFIGNTAARVLDHLPCDVLVIPPQE